MKKKRKIAFTHNSKTTQGQNKRMAASPPVKVVEAFDLSDIVASDFKFGARVKESWDFVKDGKEMKGHKWNVPLYHGNSGEKLLFFIENGTFAFNIKPGETKKKPGTTSLNYSSETMKAIKSKIDDPIMRLLLEKKEDYIPNSSKIKSIDSLESGVYKGVCEEGKEMMKDNVPARNADGTVKRFDPFTRVEVVMTKVNGAAGPDPSYLKIMDSVGNDITKFGWMNLEKQAVADIVLELDHMTISSDGKTIKVHVKLRSFKTTGEAVSVHITCRKRKPIDQVPSEAAVPGTQPATTATTATPVQTQQPTSATAPATSAPTPPVFSVKKTKVDESPKS